MGCGSSAPPSRPGLADSVALQVLMENVKKEQERAEAQQVAKGKGKGDGATSSQSSVTASTTSNTSQLSTTGSTDIQWEKLLPLFPGHISRLCIWGQPEGAAFAGGKVNESAKSFAERPRSIKTHVGHGNPPGKKGAKTKVPESEQGDPSLERYGIGLVCKKGQKPGHDVPNQDDYCLLRCGSDGVYAVYDGHGPAGHTVSRMVVASLVPHMLQCSDHLNPSKDLIDAFMFANGKIATSTEKHVENQEAQKNSQRRIMSLGGVNGLTSGATATVVIVWSGKIYSANAGDSRAIVVCGEKGGPLIAKPLSEDHRPDIEAERKRIEDCGGEVLNKDGKLDRVFFPGKKTPGLGLTRTIGDIEAKKIGVSADPWTSPEIPITSDVRFIVLGSDGLWDFVSNDEVIDCIARKGRSRVQEAMEELQLKARERWLEESQIVDDITIICIWLNDVEPPLTTENAKTEEHFAVRPEASISIVESVDAAPGSVDAPTSVVPAETK